MLFGSTPAAWYLMDHRGVGAALAGRAGQTAMMLYFVHQIIVFTIVKQWLGVAFHSWLGYWVANVVLMVVLLYIGEAWLWIRPRLRRRPSPDRELGRARRREAPARRRRPLTRPGGRSSTMLACRRARMMVTV